MRHLCEACTAPALAGRLSVWRSLAQTCVLRRQGYFYYIFGFCFIVGVLTVLITVEVSLVCTYVQLCAEDYLWWCAGSAVLHSHRVLVSMDVRLHTWRRAQACLVGE